MTGAELKAKIKATGLTMRAVAEKLGISPQSLNQMFAAANVKATTLAKVSEILHIDLSVPSIDSNIDLIPDLPVDAAAGFTDDLGSGVTPAMCRMLPKIPGIGDYDLTISVRGDSMEPSFISGDRLAIRRCRDVVEWGAAHVVDSDEGVYVKRIEDGETSITCLSDNPRYKPISIPKSSIRGIYKVVALFRAF